ncbi:MAG: sulfopyruvate decarboxylase subunit beta [Halobacteriota archaeon]|nr:sulfopyruvate decarboxylase subunit beta [Halobacteriota archaeon]
MKRIDAIRAIMDEVTDELIVCNLGIPAKELYSVKDRSANFYMLGSMGLASSIGLGLAIAKPEERVVVLEGDGSVLMNLGTLSTIAVHAPENYLLIIIDNGCYGSTGSQATNTSLCTNLCETAKASGIKNSRTMSSEEGLGDEVKRALGLREKQVLVIKAEVGNADVSVIGISPIEIKKRFMDEIVRRGRN